MWQTMLSTCNADCNSKSRRLKAADQIFNLSVLVHSATFDEAQGPGILQNRKPIITASVGNMMQETEPGQWSTQKGQWCFLEALTVEVNSKDEIAVVASCETSYNILPSSSTSSSDIGACRIPIAEVLPRLRVEDRVGEGVVYVTPVVSYDFLKDRKIVGRAFLSFETKTPLPLFHNSDETGISTMALADSHWEGPINWKRGSPNKQMQR
mmetsp:Transcript_56418/g.89598  ORF Transcript_56418/g.89598 Transcript_56418/m.89598 type:complete len:210 (+) Transcript_56418:73-702(+)